MIRCKCRMVFSLVLVVLCIACGSSFAAGMRVVPSSTQVMPGEEFYFDVVAEGIPAGGLGGIQFRLNISASNGTVIGVPDLSRADVNSIAVISPLLISPATTGHSGIGDFFWNSRGPNGILIIDNEALVNGSALYTFAHTNGATLPSGSGSVARFAVRAGSNVKPDQLNISLSDVMLLDGGTLYPLDYTTGASVQLRFMSKMPSLAIDPVAPLTNVAKPVITGKVDEGSSVNISVNGAPPVAATLTGDTWSKQLDGLIQGLNDITVSATNTYGDTVTASASITLDTIPPKVTITSPVYGLTNNKTPLLNYTVSDGTPIIKVDGTPLNTASGQTLGPLTDGIHTVIINSTDTAGNVGSAFTLFLVDTAPPIVTINPVAASVDSATLLLSGTAEAGATVTIAANTGAVAGTVSYPAKTAWSCMVTGLASGDNTFTITAVDQAGNAGSASVTVNYHPPMAVTITPENITNSFKGNVALEVNYIATPGNPLFVEQFVDANHNDEIDENDYVIRSFRVTDGIASTNPNVPGDEDGSANSSIVTTLNYYLLNDLYHAPGHYIFRATSGNHTASTAFAVTAENQPQGISGAVTINGNPLPGAIVRLSDKWHRPVAYTLSDETGNYTFYLKNAGDYLVSPVSFGYAGNAAQNLVSLTFGLLVTGYDLAVTQGTYHVSGNLKDAATGIGIDGIWIEAGSADYKSAALTGADGSYTLSLPAGHYSISAMADPTVPNPSAKGYLAFDKQSVAVDVTADGNAADITLPLAGFTVSGKVTNAQGMAIPGIPVQAKTHGSDDAREPVGYGISNSNGEYTLMIDAGNNWNISLQDSSAQSLGYVGTAINNVSTSGSPLSGNDLTVYPITAWVSGTVKDSNNRLITGDDIKLRNTNSSVVSTIATASDGTYQIGAFAGNWLVDYITRGTANQTLEQAVPLTDSQSATVDFVVDVTPPTLAVNIVVTPTTSTFQTITGTVEAGSTIIVTTDSSAVAGPVSYPAQSTWSCTVSGLSEGVNTITVTATDAAGNQTQATTQIVYKAIKTPDLIITGVTTPPTAVTGQRITIPVTVKNQGTAPAGGFYVRLYLSPNSAITKNDLYLGQLVVNSLAAGAQQTLNFTPTIPVITFGNLYFGAMVDPYNQIPESNENNNSLAGKPTTIKFQLPGLTYLENLLSGIKWE